MTTSFKTVCETHHFNREDHLDALRTWCQNHVSSDARYQGNPPEQHAHYLALAKQYLDHFLANMPAHLHETTHLFNDLTALQYASLQGYDHYILETPHLSAATLNQETPTGMTPLHLAAAAGKIHAVNALLGRGADPLKTNQNNQMPIFSALIMPMQFDDGLMHQKELIFSTLNSIAPGRLANPDSSGDTVFHLFATYGFESLCAGCLKQETRGAFLSNHLSKYPIHTAILNQQQGVVDLLLSIPTVATLTDSRGQNALHYAARYGAPEMVQRCCDASVNINAVDKENKTAWMLAVESENVEALPILIQYRADATAPEEHE